MGYWERRKLLNTKLQGLVINGVQRISEVNSFMHCAVAAPSGRGKTSRFVIPNVLWRSGQSMVITDPAGEVFRCCEAYLRQSGYRIKTLNIQDQAQSNQYNPLKRVTTHSDIRKLSTLLITSRLGTTSGDPFWNESAISLVAILIQCLKTLPEANQHLGEVYRLLNLILSEPEQMTSLMRAQLNPDALNEYLGFIAQEKTLSSIVATARAALYSFADPNVIALTQTDTMDLELLRQEPTAIFLIVPDKEAANFLFLMTLFYAQLFDFCMTPIPNSPFLPIYLLLDEFGNLSKLPDLSLAITTLRKWQVSVSILVQDVQQIAKIYGPEDLSIILNGGCSSRIIYPGLSYQTCQLIERMMGQQTVIHRKKDPANWNLVSQPKAFTEIGRPLMTAQEINQLKDDQLLFLHANKKPVLIKSTPWWKEKTLKKRGKSNRS